MSGIIESVNWGKVVMKDGTHHKDVIVKGNEHFEWDWTVTGMNHDNPGFMLREIEPFIHGRARKVIIARGFNSRVVISAEVKTFCQELSIDFTFCNTNDFLGLYEDACKEYGSDSIIAFVHSTC
jgi:hypothetical protein